MKSVFRSTPRRSVFAMIALSIAATILSSCRTTEGFGRDLQKVGNKIESEAEKRG
ncbi:MAG: hypothetical protein JWL81_2860 [Verrucomicrobiales bacterium]|nr:hypothetical protein [Verrucomicrobiales bacterium]